MHRNVSGQLVLSAQENSHAYWWGKTVDEQKIIAIASYFMLRLLTQTEPRELRDLCIYILLWSERVLNELNLHPTFTQCVF